MDAKEQEKLLIDLKSENWIHGFNGLNRYAKVPRSERIEASAVIEAALQLVERSPQRFIIAENLYLLGHEIVPQTIRFYNSTDDSRAKFCYALLLFCSKNDIGVPVLVDEIKFRREWRIAAGSHLLAQKNVEALPYIYDWLLKCSLGDDLKFPTDHQVEIITWLTKLDENNLKIPDDILVRLNSASSPKVLKEFIQSL